MIAESSYVATRSLGILSLCSGVGGLDIGVSAALEHLQFPHHTVAYSEWDPFAASVLVARMEDEAVHKAPVWGDILTLPTGQLCGRVDLTIAGIPCQPHSNAGLKAGSEDPRNLWPATRRILRNVGSSLFYLENVPGILTGDDPYFAHIIGELSEDGWDAEWETDPAHEVGAPIKDGSRVFLLAKARGIRLERIHGQGKPQGDPCGSGGNRDVSAPSGNGRQRREVPLPGARGLLRGNSDRSHSPSLWMRDVYPEPCAKRVANGVPYLVDKLRCAGNSVNPLQAAVAFVSLWDRLFSEEVA